MCRFLVFAGETYYAKGGWDDFYAEFALLDDAEVYAKGLDKEWWHIVDLEQGLIVKSEGGPY